MSGFRACSGQGRGKLQWSVCYDAHDRLWWRPKTMTGKVRRWASYESAKAFAETLSILSVEYALAKQAADDLGLMNEGQLRQLRSYAGIRSAYFGRDPFRLYINRNFA